MVQGIEALANMEYPGRLIIIGRDSPGENNLISYGITGRSPSSQARKLVADQEQKRISVMPTNYEQILNDFKSGKTGADPSLLIYLALEITKDGIAVSNGRQTSDISLWMKPRSNPTEVLKIGLHSWTYEPDKPNYTPRISGALINDRAALGIIRRKRNGSEFREYFKVSLESGKGKLMTTYTGVNKDPLQSFHLVPLDVQLFGKTPKDITDHIYDAMAPKKGDDFRVAAATVFQSRKDYSTTMFIRNRNG